MFCNKLLVSFAVIYLAHFGTADYVAAVVDYRPIIDTTPNKTVEYNLNEYVHFMEQARENSAQIIVFPEYGLTGSTVDLKYVNDYAIELPEPSENTTYSHYWLEKLSEGAIANSLYVVVNLLEKEVGKNKKAYYYNTNIVFDKSGKIVAKHRKINLIMEDGLTPGSPTQNKNVFVTDFGVTFGTFTCYDITYYTPSRSILTNSNVTDIAYPAAWTSNIPFYHSISIQAAYSKANNVNLLAANLNAIKEAGGGSGIYGSQTIYTQYLPITESSKLIVASIRTLPRLTFDFNDDDLPDLKDFKVKRFFESERYAFKRINVSQNVINEEVCYKHYCCVFNISVIPATSSDIYQIMAFKDLVVDKPQSRDTSICSLVACENENVNSCVTTNVKPTTKFKYISIETKVADKPEPTYFPFSLTDNLKAVNKGSFNIANSTMKYVVSNVNDNIVALGILTLTNNAINYSFSYVLMFFILLTNWLFN